MSDAEIVRKALEELRWACPEHAAFPAIDRLAKDAERIDWLSKNEIVQQEVGSSGWTLPEKAFRSAIDEHMEKR